MKYEEPIMEVFLLPENNIVLTSGEGFTPGQGGGGGSTSLPLSSGTSTVNF